jgi:hypothetical protein
MSTPSPDTDPALEAAWQALGDANRATNTLYPGERSARQPVHTVYGGAQLYKAETTRRLGELALRAMTTYARDPAEFALGVGLTHAGLPGSPAPLPCAPADLVLAEKVYLRVKKKLETEAVEDFRVDFEDGFGARPDAEEDEVAVRAATEVARGLKANLLPPFIGIRIKSLGEEWKQRAARTLNLFLDTLLTQTGGALPPDFIVTLPKVTNAEQP